MSPRWFVKPCDTCGGMHRSRAHAQRVHQPEGAPQRRKRKMAQRTEAGGPVNDTRPICPECGARVDQTTTEAVDVKEGEPGFSWVYRQQRPGTTTLWPCGHKLIREAE